jgi:ankyrin repeat protein
LKDGWRGLHYCAQGGHIEVAKILIDHGADISAKDKVIDSM